MKKGKSKIPNSKNSYEKIFQSSTFDTTTCPIGIIVSQLPIRHNRNSITVQYNLNSAANSV